MDVNRIASSYCVNINHQAWIALPQDALLSIQNTVQPSQLPGQPHTFLSHLCFFYSTSSFIVLFSSLLLPLFSFPLSLLYLLLFFVTLFVLLLLYCLSVCPLFTYHLITANYKCSHCSNIVDENFLKKSKDSTSTCTFINMFTSVFVSIIIDLMYSPVLDHEDIATKYLMPNPIIIPTLT